MAANVKFWDKHAKGYAKRVIADNQAYQYKLEQSRQYFSKQATAIEVGCGTGSTALLHAPHLKHLLATDLSSGMLDIAEQKRQQQNIGNVDFKQATIEGLDVNEPVDVVLALNLIHLLEDKDTAIGKIMTWLKPGGVLITSTPCLGDRMKFFKVIGPIGKALGLMPLVKVFTEQELLNSFNQQGFSIEQQWRPNKAISSFVVARKPKVE
ncbi:MULTISPECIES: class I SAM-dependent methyltransferase [unclassified Agarivorans]|uniref:class I SAM-dependent methyltransferase n=1 Tax=unclassified Agarivorans TaxID=2636026 RepID=UPI0026E13CB5|nr:MULTISPECIES: class I SAM-dependent methyltransferase [unclassified Agarivorans]MDO6687219.1 class I SAM-dependent methyltransferase [Agarivorans sp. 3_MG-2023]MDO6716854.1 class I SAM-dependent methyltransferase [Agarivorans sp. 2_MG-2023]